MKPTHNGLRFLIDHRWTPGHASEFLDGELSSRQRRRVEHHLEGCPECRELLRGLSALIDTLGVLRDEDGRLLAGSFAKTVRSRLDERPRSGG